LKNKSVLITIGEGYGNTVFATPVISAVIAMGYAPSVLVEGKWRDGFRLIENVDGVKECVGSVDDLERPIAQYAHILRTVGHRKRFNLPQEILPDDLSPSLNHEIDMNMSAARKFGFTGETPKPFVRNLRAKPVHEIKHVYISDPASNAFWQRRKFLPMLGVVNMLLKSYAVTLIGSRRDKDGWDKYPLEVNHIITDTIVSAVEHLVDVDLFISQDCGLLQLAAAMGVPVIGLFGPTSLVKNHPQGENVTIITSPEACAPCQNTPRWSACTQPMKCMSAITAKEIFNAIDTINGGVHL